MKNIFLLIVSLLFVNIVFGQEEETDFIGGNGAFRMASFGEVCKNLERENDLAACSQDRIEEYISTLKTPEIVEKNKLKVTTIINFGISTTGKVKNVIVKKSSGNKEIDELCLAHVKNMPNWNPEVYDDMLVDSKNLNLTFKFKYTQKEGK